MAYTPLTFAYKEVLTSAKMQQLADNDAYLKGVADGLTTGWTAYGPTLTVDVLGTNPTLYTGTGKYVRLGGATGKTVLAFFNIAMGASFTPGSGNYRIGLPVAGVPGGTTCGVARMFDSSTSSSYMDTRVGMATANTLSLQYSATHGGGIANVGNSLPWVWASGDIIDGFIIYEAT